MRIPPSTTRGPLPTLAVLLLGIVAAGCGGSEGASDSAKTTVARAVKLERASVRTFEETVRQQGNLSAKHTALVGAEIPGTLDAVFVKEGDAVEAGTTRLFQTDARKLGIAVDKSRLDVALATAGIREAQARLGQVQIAADKATVDYERHKALYAKAAISTDIMEKVELGYKQAQAQLDHLKIVVELAQQKKRQADLGLRMALQNLADSTVEAPISGVVAQRMQEPGEMAAPGRPVVRIEDPSVLEASTRLPATYYSKVTPGVTPVRMQSYGIDLGTHPISYKSPTISNRDRTFEIRCIIESPPAGVAPGGMVEMSIQLGESEDLAVPLASVVRRGGEDRIFIVHSGRAKGVTVSTGGKDDGWIAVRAAGLAPNTPVVMKGQSMLDDGDPVRVVGETPPERGPHPVPVAPITPITPPTVEVKAPGEAG